MFDKRQNLALALLLLTSVHHAYGAYVYQTPWRLHAVALAAVSAAAIVLLGRVQSRLAYWSAVALTLLVPIGLIGLFEGAYNHVLKNAFYFGGAGPGLMQRWFPAPTYELPNDVFFELTGVLQFFLAIAAAWRLRRGITGA
jgi:hypothetical protein